MGAQQMAEARVGAEAATADDLTTRVKNVAAIAAKHAGAVDSASRFPAESFESIKAQRLLGIMVPRALGGEGASIADLSDVCYVLAQGCAATGMIYAMHQIKTACILRHMRGSVALERLLRRLCTE